jgi:purine-binding chemotaxis protein CheW
MISKTNRQFTTFHISGRLYGIEVLRVQEVTRALPIAQVPLAPKFVHGLINLRGQVSTAISLRELFQISEPAPADQMNVVCRLNDVLISFLVDGVGDVLELDSKDFELAPETVPEGTRRFIEGVYKTSTALMSVVDVDKIADYFANAAKEIGKEAQL